MMHKFFAAVACAALATQAWAGDGGLLGQSEPPGSADRTIVVTPATSYVNVDRGDVVRFVVGDKTFSWSFATPSNISVIELNAIAPAGTFDHPVRAYIKRLPLYDGG